MNKYLISALAVLVIAGSNSFGRENNGVAGAATGNAAGKQAREAKAAGAGKAVREAKASGEVKAAREAKKAERKVAREKTCSENKEAKSLKGQEVVDNREARQDKRIQHGIDKGYLTADEITKLNAQQDKIGALETSLTGDGSMSKQDFRQLQSELNTASHCIWGEKHDTDGNQMAVYRFGKNVFAKSDLTAKMADPNLSKSEAKKLCGDFKTMMDLKKQLSGNVAGADRDKLQAQYDALLNNYYEVK